MFDYDYSYDLDVIVKDGKLIETLNEVSKESIDDYNSLNLKIYDILYAIGKFILVFGVVFIIVEILGEIFGLLFFDYILYLLFKLMKYLKNKENKYKSSIYEDCSVEIINIKKVVKYRGDGRYRRSYYTIMQYINNGIMRRKVVYKNVGVGLVKVGDRFNVLINRRDNKVITKQRIELVGIVYKIIVGLFIFMAVMNVVDIIKYLV